MNYFGRTKLSEKEFTKYYNDLVPTRNPGTSLPLNKLRELGLLSPENPEEYAYWQIFILHDIMQMKAEFVFDFKDKEIFCALLKADFQSIDSSKLGSRPINDGGFPGFP